jgi:hypothetical protein
MERLLKQLDSIKAIVDTFSPNQIVDKPKDVAHVYKLYADSYQPIHSVITLKNQLIDLIKAIVVSNKNETLSYAIITNNIILSHWR